MSSDIKICVLAVLLIGLLLGLASCERAASALQVITKNIPVESHREPPAELIAPITETPPTFTSPSDPAATSALSAGEEKNLKKLLASLKARIAAWQAWAAE